MGPAYRPWGPIDWLLRVSPRRPWKFLGALNTEDRSLSTWRLLSGAGYLAQSKLIRIENLTSRFKEQADQMLAERCALFLAQGGREGDFSDHGLLEPYGEILDFCERFTNEDDSSVVLDVSSMPKRFFYPILRVLFKSTRVSDLLVTYAIPKAYTNEKLAINCDDWSHLPTFSGEYSRDPTQMLIVNVGFEPMGLPDEIGVEDTRRIKLLFPFPAPPQSVRRAWGFVQTLQKRRNPNTFDLFRVNVKDVSDAFERLRSLTHNGRKKASLAPFGPKTISVAMCLFATLAGSEVSYTQPKVYHPQYSTGVAERNGQPEIYGYWIRMGGRSLYEL